MTVPLGIYKEQLSKTTSQLADFWPSVRQQMANSQLLHTCTQYSVKRLDELQSSKCNGLITNQPSAFFYHNAFIFLLQVIKPNGKQCYISDTQLLFFICLTFHPCY